jgi:uncharacterized protein with GYD domain
VAAGPEAASLTCQGRTLGESEADDSLIRGEPVPKYMTTFTYTCGSWARLVKTPGDRTLAAERVLESLGGSLECVYWLLGAHEDGLLIVDLPDSVTAQAWETVINRTGAFKSVETHELLTQQQLLDTLVLARDVGPVYEVPGQPD